MSDSPIPSFSSEELRKAVAEAKPVIKGFDEARNRLSEDIKALEAYFQSLELRTTLRYPLGKSLVPYDDEAEQHLAAALEYGGGASGWIEEEALVWAEAKPNKFRLMHELNRWDGYIEVDSPGGPYFWDEETLKRKAKPLIEAKFEVRKRMHDHLPDFVRALSNQLAIGRSQLQDEVPF